MQISVSWYSFGPGTQPGIPALQGILARIFGNGRATLTSTVQTGTATIGALRHETHEGVPDDGVTGPITSSLPSVRGDATFMFPGALTDNYRTPTGAALVTTLANLRRRAAAVTTVTAISAVITVPRMLTREEKNEINIALGDYLERNGGFLLSSAGVSIRPIAAPRAGSGVGVFLGLIGLLGLGYFINKD